MKKNFYKRPRRKRLGVFKALSWSTFVLILVLAGARLFFPGVLEGAAKTFAHPFWSGKNQTAEVLSGFLGGLKGNRRLVEENQTLQQELRTYETLALRNRMLEEENQALLALFGRAQFKSLVLAPVLARPPQTLYDTLLVDVGKDTRVAVGNRVVTNGSIVIGTLTHVGGRVGTVTLFSTSGIETEVFVGTTTASVIAKGLGGGNFTAEVPRELGIQKGDLITLTDVPTLLLSEVEEVISNSADPFELVLFQNPVNINTLRWVEIVTDDEEIPQRQERATTTEAL